VPFKSKAMRSIVQEEWKTLLAKQAYERAQLDKKHEMEREAKYRQYKGTYDDLTQEELNGR